MAAQTKVLRYLGDITYTTMRGACREVAHSAPAEFCRTTGAREEVVLQHMSRQCEKLHELCFCRLVRESRSFVVCPYKKFIVCTHSKFVTGIVKAAESAKAKTLEMVWALMPLKYKTLQFSKRLQQRQASVRSTKP